ncbi:hypothetical protein CONPUDRAFT_146873 [Coniophora puteana RWD-64-598 SS2]|uniref:Transmembrane protein n=1 Tax=Coniophora puteana (strain RWD-64-598) TaxID=741705 RepID=A0A5M3MB65_CONPW|nr:uncharacterized protein CONPUDRAFT_146873 [Coniophora puteana RWD-64-598 SS2]EIW76462.1 hypothetical protein CONPUDRAFT_146873 [Coniophora puteana RWD-64-598 SS2]
MPSPMVRGAIAGVSIAAGIALFMVLKERVYEPHIAPYLESLAEEFIARRRAHRMRQASTAAGFSHGDVADRTPLWDAQDEEEDRHAARELESLVGREVDGWRNLSRRKESSGLVIEEAAGVHQDWN